MRVAGRHRSRTPRRTFSIWRALRFQSCRRAAGSRKRGRNHDRQQARALLGKDATEAEFKALPLADFRVIHLAVHGLGNSEFPDRAALVLGSSPTAGPDGLLQVREIRDLLPLRADLVTLSACDTGNGKLLGEEGIASLERAFLLAGAKSVNSESLDRRRHVHDCPDETPVSASRRWV